MPQVETRPIRPTELARDCRHLDRYLCHYTATGSVRHPRCERLRSSEGQTACWTAGLESRAAAIYKRPAGRQVGSGGEQWRLTNP